MTSSLAYNPAVCDLCGSSEYSVLLELPLKRSLRSDRKIIPEHLLKFICHVCGLVRGGLSFDSGELQDLYANSYSVPTEHYFYTARGPISRSSVFCDWMISLVGSHRWQAAERILEIGAGSGELMQEFAHHFPGKSIEGTELNHAAVAEGQQRGLSIRHGMLSPVEAGFYDIIYAIAVLEHVVSPSAFLAELRKRLRPGGWLILCQPTQDVPSYDLFFADHLHHFGTEHLRQYALKCGFRQHGFVVGQEWMPNFSLHLWQAVNPMDGFMWAGPLGYSTCATTAREVMTDMQRLDAALASLHTAQHRVAVFGLNEVYWLARAYSSLADFPVVCGLDDNPRRLEYASLPFPVLVPEEAVSLGVQDVLLAMNKVYYPQARRRIEQLGIAAHTVLS